VRGHWRSLEMSPFETAHATSYWWSTVALSSIVSETFRNDSVRRSLAVDARRTVVTAFVAGRLDYCNAVLYGAEKTTIQRLQTVMNAAAWLVGGIGKYDHVTPGSMSLRWAGSEFQFEGPAYASERPPYEASFTRGKSRWPRSADRRWRRPEMPETGWQ